MTRILVTGGAGYIGSHTCKELNRSGYEVHVFDNLSRGHREFVRWGELHIGDLCDFASVAEVVRDVRPDAVVHFAALAYVGESCESPASYYQTNVQGSINLLEAMRLSGIPRIVFSSSCAVYGIPVSLPIFENFNCEPINPYGASKMMVERIIADFGRAYGIGSVSLRYFNAAGADLEGELGEWHDPETHAIPLAIEAARIPTERFRILGIDYPTSDGSAVRDYVHVTDLARAHVKALEYQGQAGRNISVNLGTGVGVSVKEILSAVAEVAGEVAADVAPRRDGDPAALFANGDKAREVLGWAPVHSDIRRIVETAWRWQSGPLQDLKERALTNGPA